jgi:hypothetical protein
MEYGWGSYTEMGGGFALYSILWATDMLYVFPGNNYAVNAVAQALTNRWASPGALLTDWNSKVVTHKGYQVYPPSVPPQSDLVFWTWVAYKLGLLESLVDIYSSNADLMAALIQFQAMIKDGQVGAPVQARAGMFAPKQLPTVSKAGLTAYGWDSQAPAPGIFLLTYVEGYAMQMRAALGNQQGGATPSTDQALKNRWASPGSLLTEWNSKVPRRRYTLYPPPIPPVTDTAFWTWVWNAAGQPLEPMPENQ